jgi:hypothetical protein
LKDAGHPISPPTVGRLLRQQDYSLKVNRKQKDEVGPMFWTTDRQK